MAPSKDEQIKGLIERIKAVREGAFLPPSERPFVVAGLLPLVGARGVQLFQVLGFGS